MTDDREKEVDKAFGQWLRLQRELKGFTIKEAALITTIPWERLLELERGNAKISVRKLEAVTLAHVYGVTVRQLVDRAMGEPFDAKWIGK